MLFRSELDLLGLLDVGGRARLGQVELDGIGEQRRRHDEDHQQHQHHVDQRHHVDLGQVVVVLAGKASEGHVGVLLGGSVLGLGASQGDDLVANGKRHKPTQKLPGSTSPDLYSDQAGNPKFVVKKGGAKGQNDADFTANKIYDALAGTLGTHAVKSRIIDGKLVNGFIQGGRTISDLSPEEFNKLNIKGKIKGSLAADALLANWD